MRDSLICWILFLGHGSLLIAQHALRTTNTCLSLLLALSAYAQRQSATRFSAAIPPAATNTTGQNHRAQRRPLPCIPPALHRLPAGWQGATLLQRLSEVNKNNPDLQRRAEQSERGVRSAVLLQPQQPRQHGLYRHAGEPAASDSHQPKRMKF